MSEHTAEDALGSNAQDAFAPENIGVIHFIQNQRIYDVLLALLTDANPEMAKDLLELHATGSFMGPEPRFDGHFITDEVNSSE